MIFNILMFYFDFRWKVKRAKQNNKLPLTPLYLGLETLSLLLLSVYLSTTSTKCSRQWFLQTTVLVAKIETHTHSVKGRTQTFGWTRIRFLVLMERGRAVKKTVIWISLRIVWCVW